MILLKSLESGLNPNRIFGFVLTVNVLSAMSRVFTCLINSPAGSQLMLVISKSWSCDGRHSQCLVLLIQRSVFVLRLCSLGEGSQHRHTNINLKHFCEKIKMDFIHVRRQTRNWIIIKDDYTFYTLVNLYLSKSLSIHLLWNMFINHLNLYLYTDWSLDKP